jgi:L-glutamine:2-deoxy-scyllo-inosose/3-amino-2,3-dideoxy-scyllo-inosose aminotransferase
MLAIHGGEPVKNVGDNPWPSWPIWDDMEMRNLREVMESGVWSYNGPKEQECLQTWKKYTGSNHAFLVANGTISIQLALEACGIGYGDEVIVPGLTWQATAAAVLDVNAIPILVDVEPDTWCMDPQRVRQAITGRTKAIIPVHLYGNMADMDAILEIAGKHNLYVIEDAAHKHGGRWRDKAIGSLGDIGSFSLQLSKVLTAGEGGILTTNNLKLGTRLDALRNCGRRPSNMVIDKSSGQYGEDGNFIQSGNYRITEFQAAVLLGQLSRLEQQNALRRKNADLLDSIITPIPGMTPMRQDPRETKRTFFKYAWRYDENDVGIPNSVFRKALSAELGVQLESCYQPLNNCSLYRPHTKKRHRLNDAYWEAIDPSRFELPVCWQVYDSIAITLPQPLLLSSEEDIRLVGIAIEKVLSHKDSLM